MEWLYLLGIKTYGFGIFIASFFNAKAKQWIEGRKGILKRLKKEIGENEEWVWFHCSSLGEFEQARPLIEAYRIEFPTYKVLLTFFSPSGYEVMKNWNGANYVTYMPLDGPQVSNAFISIVNPKMVFFIKYDFWYYYIKICRSRKIPFFSISSIFRPYQIYFRWYGKFFKDILKRVTHFFVQNQSSLELMYKNSLPDVTVSGDTRFDRVYQHKEKLKKFPEITQWTNHNTTMVMGSTWPTDIKKLKSFIQQSPENFKFIIAPHEVGQSQITYIENELPGLTLKYSDLDSSGKQSKVLIIDNIGMLSSLYGYAKYAYIGGGFNKGIHNILEATVFGIPVFIGPTYKKFQEGVDLVSKKSVQVISDSDNLLSAIKQYENDADAYQFAANTNRIYVEQKKGATSIIMSYLHINYN